MEKIVYILCALTSLLAAALLLRGYAQSKFRLLFWTGLAFSFFALANVVLFLDLVVFPDLDLTLFRTSLNLIGASFLVFGLVWEVR